MRAFFGTILFLAFLGTGLFPGFELDAANSSPRTIWANGRRSVFLTDAAKMYNSKVTRGAGVYALTRNKDRFLVYPDKRYAYFNNVKINLCFSPALREGAPLLSKSDFDNIVAPLFGRRTPIRHKVGLIVLDPGHGGKDQGAAGKRLLEKTITLNLTGRVSKILSAYGYKVRMTRTRDSALSLDARSAFANRVEADLFVSIHVNSTGTSSVTGIESFCMTPENVASSNGGKPDARSFAGNAKNKNNFLLAYFLQRGMVSRTGATDRGVKFARFAVLRDVKCPAALVEVGFISNPTDEANLGSAAYLDKLARGIASGIINYHRSLSR